MIEEIVLKVQNLSKVYRLGEIGTGTISHDLNRWWAKVRGRQDPFATIEASNDRTQKAQKGEYVKAIANINFEVNQGEVLGIVGKNGAGKSTLLKIISKITSPTTGSIIARGRIASLLEVGTGMHPEMTGRENVFLNGTILGMTKREVAAKFDEIMDFAGCAKYAETPVKRYSSGMKVRLGFAVAAFLEPEILIVDEVLAVGDAEFQKMAVKKMHDVSHGQGRTVLIVSHNMTTIRSLCNKSILLEKGRLIAFDETSRVLAQYSSQFSLTDSLAYKELKNEFFSILKLAITSRNGQDVNQVFFGGEFKIEFRFELKDISFYQCLVIRLYNEFDERISTFSNVEEGLALSALNGKLLNFNFPEFSLMPGSYYLSIYVFNIHDSIPVFEGSKALSFEVQPATINNSLKPYEKKHGVFRFFESLTVNSID
ncbi:MAG: polysaccharide ABC transporter ATP-binding protein [Imperialibacter sp.]|uniref:ABC transporter ATP-binding protein n=1 Tax=Imperialibacter sp. TaxID=2038411 RepID=UPI0032F04EAC